MTAWLSALEIAAVVVAIVLLIGGLDDLLIDLAYWVRRGWRAITVYRVHDRFDASVLSDDAEQPFAILVPAWGCEGIVGRMLQATAANLEYEHYQIFVGVHPNDPGTEREIEEACATLRNVHKVVCARPGPASSASRLNAALEAALRFERRVDLPFAAFVLHDAGDVVPPIELRLFNHLVPRNALVQLPVHPVEHGRRRLTSSLYQDELAEQQGKEIPLREAIAGQVPATGTGTCLSRRAVLSLLADGDGLAFDRHSVSHPYDIGIRLRTRGLKQILVQVPDVPRRDHAAPVPDVWHRPSGRSGLPPIGVREYFPESLGAGIHHKSHEIASAIHQAFVTGRLTGRPTVDYFLWRDRKAVVTSVATLAGLCILALALGLLTCLAATGRLEPLRRVVAPGLLTGLAGAHLLLMANRVVQRAIFVQAFYGPWAGLLSAPRLFWGGIVNPAATFLALARLVRHGAAHMRREANARGRPAPSEPSRVRRPLGHILVAHGAIDQGQLEEALASLPRGLRLGSALVHAGAITAEQLAAAVAEQCGVAWERLESLDLRRDLLRELPEELALRYAVIPVREEGATLVVGSEAYVDAVSLGAMARTLDRPVRYVIVPKGRVTVGLRHWYVNHGAADPRQPLQQAVRRGTIPEDEAERLWNDYVSRQLLFAEILLSLGHLEAAVLGSVLLRHEQSALSLGEYLVRHGIVSSAALDEALDLQRTLQASMPAVLARAGIPAQTHETPAEAPLPRKRAV